MKWIEQIAGVLLFLVILASYAWVILNADQMKADQADQQRIQREREREQRLARARKRWASEGRTIQAKPTLAIYKGDATTTKYEHADPGALGVVDDEVHFVSESSAGFELTIPLDQIRWMAHEGATLVTEYRDRWHIHRFGFQASDAWIQAMQNVGVARIPAGTFGPLETLRLRQNVIGRWTRDHTVTLYLMPDRVLVNWRTALRNDQIRELAVIDTPAWLNILDRDLLRITYEADNRERTTIGFVMDDGTVRRWAQTLHERSGAPLAIIAGRKKKRV